MVRRESPVVTREGAEDAGWQMQASDGTALRLWVRPAGMDLDAGARLSLRG